MKDLQMLSKMKSINKKEDDSESSSFERKFRIKNCNTNYRLKIRQNSILNKKHHFLGGVSFFWWAGMDSNHRRRSRRIYSPLHLAALQPTLKKMELVKGIEPSTC